MAKVNDDSVPTNIAYGGLPTLAWDRSPVVGHPGANIAQSEAWVAVQRLMHGDFKKDELNQLIDTACSDPNMAIWVLTNINVSQEVREKTLNNIISSPNSHVIAFANLKLEEKEREAFLDFIIQKSPWSLIGLTRYAEFSKEEISKIWKYVPENAKRAVAINLLFRNKTIDKELIDEFIEELIPCPNACLDCLLTLKDRTEYDWLREELLDTICHDPGVAYRALTMLPRLNDRQRTKLISSAAQHANNAFNILTSFALGESHSLFRFVLYSVLRYPSLCRALQISRVYPELSEWARNQIDMSAESPEE